MIWGAHWWDVLTAFGTVGAVVVSIGLATREVLRTRRAEDALAAEREQTSQNERRTVASLVSGWTESVYVPADDGTHFVRHVTAFVSNESNEPIYNLSVVLALGMPPVQLGPLSIPVPIPVLPARYRRSWDITTGMFAQTSGVGEVPVEPVASLDFEDSQGVSWRRKFDGTLDRDPGRSVPPPDEDGEKQVGDIDNHYNPLSAAFGFLGLLRRATSVSDLKPVLSPAASGWTSMDPGAVASLRDELASFGMAAHAWYPAPRVAYVRLIHDQDIERARQGEAARVKFLTLTFLAGKGWFVFSVGPAVSEPDWIEFPRKDLHRELRG